MPFEHGSNKCDSFWAIIDRLIDPVFIVDKEGHLLQVNTALEKMVGLEGNELIGKSFIGTVFQKRNKRVALDIMSGRDHDGTAPHSREVFVDENGQNRSLAVYSRKIDFAGIPAKLVLLRDATDRQAVQEQVQREPIDETESFLHEARFRIVMDSALDAIILIDDEMKIAYWNPAAEKIFSYPKRKPLADPFLVSFRSELLTKYLPGVEDLVKNDSCAFGGRIFETFGVKRDGREFPVELSYAKLRLRGDFYGVVIVRDITERKALQKSMEDYSEHLKSMVDLKTLQLKEANERLVKSERMAAVGELAGMIGHDLRNPLAGIRGAAYYLKTKYGYQIGDDGQTMLETINKCINYSDKIINDLSDYSKEIRIELTETTPQQLLRNVLSLIEVPEKIRIIDQTDDASKFKADTDKMTRLLTNIVKNALDAMPNGGTLTIKNEKIQEKMVFRITDTGIGIPEENLNKIWTPLFTTKAKGMGFGLPICKRIAEAHMGTISIESRVNKGTTVTITIPDNLNSKNEETEWVPNLKMTRPITSPW